MTRLANTCTEKVYHCVGRMTRTLSGSVCHVVCGSHHHDHLKKIRDEIPQGTQEITTLANTCTGEGLGICIFAYK